MATLGELRETIKFESRNESGGIPDARIDRMVNAALRRAAKKHRFVELRDFPIACAIDSTGIAVLDSNICHVYQVHYVTNEAEWQLGPVTFWSDVYNKSHPHWYMQKGSRLHVLPSGNIDENAHLELDAFIYHPVLTSDTDELLIASLDDWIVAQVKSDLALYAGNEAYTALRRVAQEEWNVVLSVTNGTI